MIILGDAEPFAKFKTKAVSNGFNPRWHEAFEVNMTYDDFVFLR